MAKFKPYKIESSQLEDLSISEGQFIVTTDTNKIYLDEDNATRIELSPSPTKTSQLINDSDFMSGMYIAKYGITTYDQILDAYSKNHIVYCRASSSSNPASGSQTRMAFLAYVQAETNPTEFEFQYYRSVSTHSDSTQGDEVYVYKINKNSGWSVTKRNAYTKVVAGTGMSSSYSNGTITLNATNNGTVTQVTAGTGLTTGQSSADITSIGTLSLDTSGVTAGTYQGLTIDSYGRVISASDQGYTTNTGTVTQVSAGTGLTGGDITTTGTIALDESGVTAGTYQGLTVDKYGRVTAASDQGYTSNTGTITGVSVNGTSVATSGVANITSIPASTLTGAIPSAVIATTQSQGDNSTKIATTAYVDTAIDNLPEPMVFKGSLGTGGTITSLPVDGSATIGDTYKVITDGTYASKVAKVGDTFICLTKTSSANTWELIPSGDEPSGTVTSITIKATSPIAIDSSSAITSSGTRTLSHANSGVTAGTYKSVTVNATGHITAGTNPTTISGYGITDAKIANGVITLGSNTITPLTSSSIGNVSIAGLPHGFQITGPIDGQITVNGTYTLDAACAKGVDTSISAASTSTNLPTSQAVASFVEGKGYLTSEINSNLVNGSATGSLRTIGSATEDSNYTIGSYAFAEGYGSKTSASYAHAEGMNTQATGSWGSHAEGYNTKATNNMAHAEGDSSVASGVSSHAENGSTASGSFSHSEGNTSAAGAYQHTQGRYNITDSNNTYVDIIGNGTSNDDRSNAATVDWNGNGWFAGDVYVGSTSGTNKDAGSVKLAKTTELRAAGTGLSLSGTTLNHSNSVTAGTAGTSSATSGSTVAVPYITYDAQGHITASGTHTHTISGFATTDTKNTTGTTNTTDKIYLAGGKSQGDNPQTYSNVNCYASGGKLYSNAKEVVNLSDAQALTNKTYDGLTLTKATTGFIIAGGTTSKTLTVNDNYTLGAACAKAVDSSISAASTSTNLPTSAAVASFVEGKGYTTNGIHSFYGTSAPGTVSGSVDGDIYIVIDA